MLTAPGAGELGALDADVLVVLDVVAALAMAAPLTAAAPIAAIVTSFDRMLTMSTPRVGYRDNSIMLSDIERTARAG